MGGIYIEAWTRKRTPWVIRIVIKAIKHLIRSSKLFPLTRSDVRAKKIPRLLRRRECLDSRVNAHFKSTQSLNVQNVSSPWPYKGKT